MRLISFCKRYSQYRYLSTRFRKKKRVQSLSSLKSDDKGHLINAVNKRILRDEFLPSDEKE
ncbi:hypothetical protein LEP1GSC050_2133 [Leptospira broomii serovar Hurstbridge str. 5399]|uniref:Uncharacterized protein n=1 Tax=Leptospira broomii serovar Hurstbridge str. 5399 TaxID=1049789 RepID=T0FD28_9LEPT|nr:hypothetical protein LEP1GSC050_2133 [Leptospira broomii serovar Hurstbridge str. 5399]